MHCSDRSLDLFSSYRHVLAADHLLGVDHVAAGLQHAALEDREKADRPGAYDGDISGEGLLRQATSPVIGCALVHESRAVAAGQDARSEEHTSELQSLMRISYAVFCLKKKTKTNNNTTTHNTTNRTTHKHNTS